MTVTNLTGAERRIRRAQADQATLPVSEAIARRLAPWWLDAPSNAVNEEVEQGDVRLLDVLRLPEPLDALGVPPLGSADSVGVTPVVSGVGFLRAPIGKGSGAPVVLDLNEAADGGMGPHGLLVGATGSGKSELLRTLVAGLALTHPPDLLAMVLVDFKGGAALASLAGLPHTAGLITNLQSEPRMVERARAALRGEVERRQRLLRAAGDLDNIRRYQELRSADPSLDPLPRLLIVVDEFGELLGAHPDFLDLFTAIGRTGRSLGIHLLLASQRLEAGRLRGLDSHLRYRICLRTFSPTDSAAVLGTPDAYLLPSAPGHGILKVDSDPPRRFKGLLLSVPPDPTAPEDQAPLPEVLPFDPLLEPTDTDGEGQREHHRHRQHNRSRAAQRHAVAVLSGLPSVRAGDLDAVLAALRPPVRAGPPTHRIWLPPLAAAIPLNEVVQPGPPRSPGDDDWLHVPIGVVDRPFQQAQEPLVLDFSGRSGHLAIAGAPRTGKSTLLATLIAGFAVTHQPDQAQFYCVDLGGGLLHELAALPHVGAVLGAREPDEMRRLIRELRTVATEREEGFRRLGIESMPAWHQWRAEAPPAQRDGYGEVFLVIDGWSRFRQDFTDLEPEIEALASGSLHYGIHLVVASNRWADFRLALRDNLGGRLELRLNDPIESEIDRAAATRLPDRLPGRGLTPAGDEFQSALPALAADRADHAMHDSPASAAQTITVRSIADHALRSPTGATAPRLHPLPTLIPLDALLTSTGCPTTPPGPAGPTGEPKRSMPPPDVPAEDLDCRPTGPPRPDARAASTASASPRRPGRVDPVPIGLHDHRLEVVQLDLAAAPHLLVFGDPESGKTSALRCIATVLMARHTVEDLRLVVVDYRRTLADLGEAAHCDAHAATAAAAALAADSLRTILDERLAGGTGQPSPTAHRQTWRGPQYLLLVDDYDLVAAGRNPLDPLLDLVAQGRDVGLHVVIARPVSGSARAAFEPFYQRVRGCGSPGLILSGDPREGPVIGARTATHLPPGRGHLVTRNGRSGLVQLAWTPPDPNPAILATAGPP
jgi:S-DNA-T family DNA segregation ATPase FtsK/SpoIIIE